MPWKLVHVDRLDEDALTDDELLAMHIVVRDHMGETGADNACYRAWLKLQPACRWIWEQLK